MSETHPEHEQENQEDTEEDQDTEEQDADEQPSAQAQSRRSHHPPDMMIYHTLPVHDDGTVINPRRENTYGYRAMELVINAGLEGISYRDYLRGGGRPNDLGWDLAKGNVRTVEPGSDPNVISAKAAEIEAQRAAKQAEKEEKQRLRAELAEEKTRLKAEAKAERDRIKAETAAAREAARNDAISVANANATDANREATEDGVGPVPTGNAPSTANARSRRSRVQNVGTGIPV